MVAFIIFPIFFLCVAFKHVSAGFTNIQLDGSCGNVINDIGNILDEIVAQATIVHKAMTMMQNNDPNLLAADNKVILNTFDAFFQIENGGTQRAVILLQILDRMANLETNQPSLTIYCGDSHLYQQSQTDQNGQPITTPPGFELVFVDPNNPNAPRQFMGQNFLRCQDPAANGNLQLAYASFGTRIVLCPRTTGLPGQSPNPNTPLTGQYLLDDQRTVANVLFHELLHILIPGMTGDQSGGNGQGGERYGYSDCHSLRGTDDSIKNPDSVALYCLALWLGGNDWSSGTAQPYPTG